MLILICARIMSVNGHIATVGKTRVTVACVIMAGKTAEKSVKQVKKRATIGSFVLRGSTSQTADPSEYAGSLHVSPAPSSSVPPAHATSPPPRE